MSRLSALKSKALVGSLLALVIALSPAVRPLAGPATDANAEPPGPPLSSSDSVRPGVISCEGNVRVNDNEVKTGATVLNGSTVETGGDGAATVDLDKRGLVELRKNTKALLTLLQGVVNLDLQGCGTLTQAVSKDTTGHLRIVKSDRIHIWVDEGKVTVKFAGGKKEEVLKGCIDKHYDDATDVFADPGAVYSVDCGDEIVAIYWWPETLLGLLAAATGVAVGITLGNEGPGPKPTPPQSTPI